MMHCRTLCTVHSQNSVLAVCLLGAGVQLQNGAIAKNKTVTAAAFPDIDKAVFAWFCEQRANKVPLSSTVLQQKVLD